MSVHVICDSCDKIIYDEKNATVINIDILNRYSPHNKRVFSLHLCDQCDMNVALALLKTLPRVAGAIQPNVFNEAKELGEATK